jgi:hypothetical protein
MRSIWIAATFATLALIGVAVGVSYLAGKGSRKEAERFHQSCAGAGFTAEQCAFLATLARKSEGDGDAAMAMSAAALGMAASAKR